jgi:hypothetical protein
MLKNRVPAPDIQYRCVESLPLFAKSVTEH